MAILTHPTINVPGVQLMGDPKAITPETRNVLWAVDRPDRFIYEHQTLSRQGFASFGTGSLERALEFMRTHPVDTLICHDLVPFHQGGGFGRNSLITLLQGLKIAAGKQYLGASFIDQGAFTFLEQAAREGYATRTPHDQIKIIGLDPISRDALHFAITLLEQGVIGFYDEDNYLISFPRVLEMITTPLPSAG